MMYQLNKQLILGSKSPRRQSLLKEAGFDFLIDSASVEEIYPDDLPSKEVAEYLANLKSAPLLAKHPDAIIIGADSIVVLGDEILGKPKDRTHALETLRKLAGKDHQVITGVSIRSTEQLHSFSQSTSVMFDELSEEMITHYVDTYEPYDKAGSYAIQEWIGMVGIKGINGDYFNVMGLPVNQLRRILLDMYSL